MSSERMPPDDSELEDFLAGRHPLGAAYRAASQDETAPPELDAAILAAAREAVRTPVQRRPRWIQPVALAATLVLGLSVLMNVWREPALREQAVPMAESMPQPVREEAPMKDSAVEMQSAPSGAAEPQPIQSPEKKKAERVAPKPAAPMAQAAPPPPPAEADPDAGAVSERGVSRFNYYDMLDKQSSISEMAPAASATAPAAVAPDASREAEARQRVEDERALQRMQKAMPQAAARGATAQDSSGGLGASADAVSPRSVEQWIAQMREQLARGDEVAARESLAEFRRVYPGVELPEDLAKFEGGSGSAGSD